MCLVDIAYQQYSSKEFLGKLSLGKDLVDWTKRLATLSEVYLHKTWSFMLDSGLVVWIFCLEKFLWGLLSIISWWIVGTVDLIGAGFVWLIS